MTAYNLQKSMKLLGTLWGPLLESAGAITEAAPGLAPGLADGLPDGLADGLAAGLDRGLVSTGLTLVRPGAHAACAGRGEGKGGWHESAGDTLLHVLVGQVTLRMEGGDVVLNEGDFFKVPAGVRYLPEGCEAARVAVLTPRMDRGETADKGRAA